MDQELNEGHYHEAMDRSYCVQDILERMLLDHPVFQAEQHKEWREKVEQAQTLLYEIYQSIGRNTVK